ncbi:MAG: helix-turn-helix transcriptional regulator [Planctomycetaceae bacterium]|nr:helix-turn-helix transcriptional regulator [Planctomycetaceae bacterium]
MNVAEPLLQSISTIDTDAWCFVPSGQRGIQWWSSAFDAMWGLNALTTAQPGEIIAEAIVVECFERQEISANTIQSLLQHAPGSPVSHVTIYGCQQITVETHQVLQENHYIGRLIAFRKSWPIELTPAAIAGVQDAKRRLSALSLRESEILQEIFDGETNREIARQRAISVKTVEKHRSRLMHKLKVRNPAELFRLLARATVADSEPMFRGVNLSPDDEH